ncbi:MAG: GyrI-like domain-containing protein [Planctomycetota bacterium]
MPALNVSRSINIDSDPQTVFDRLRDFRTWGEWSPWLLADPKTTVTVSENADDVGAIYGWDGEIVGAGSMEHLGLSAPAEHGNQGSIQCKLRFTRPWKSEADVRFVIVPSDPSGKSTTVHWEMDSNLPFFLFWMKGMMQSLISMDYERGLKMAKELIESGRIESKTEAFGSVGVEPRRILGITSFAKLPAVGPAMEKVVVEAKQKLEAAGIPSDGQWVSVYDHLNLKTRDLRFTTGIEVSGSTPIPSGMVEKKINGGKAIHVTHVGRYDHLGNAWFTAHQVLQSGTHKKLKQAAYEVYENTPDNAAPEDLVTHVYLPVKA